MKLFHRPKQAMNLPTEQEINPEGSNDGETAVNHFVGKTREQITRDLAARLHWYFYEDFLWMGARAFCFYFPAVADYVATAEARVDHEAIENFCYVIERRLNSDFAQIRDSFPAIIRFCEYILTHFGDYGYDAESDADLRQRLRTIQHRCAEPALHRMRRSRIGELLVRHDL